MLRNKCDSSRTAPYKQNNYDQFNSIESDCIRRDEFYASRACTLQSNHTAPFETLYVASQSQSAVRQELDRRACLPGTIALCAVMRAEAVAGINYLAGVPPYT